MIKLLLKYMDEQGYTDWHYWYWNGRQLDNHLMYNHTPFSACGMYLGDFSGMRQTFKLEQTSCPKCLSKWEEYKTNTIRQNKIEKRYEH